MATRIVNPRARRLEELRASFDRQRKVAYGVGILNQRGEGSEGTEEEAELRSLQATEPARKAEYAALLARARADEPAAIREWVDAHCTALERIIGDAPDSPRAKLASVYVASFRALKEGTRDVVELDFSLFGDYASPLLGEAPLPLSDESLRTVCGEPTMALEDCPTCRELPESCERFEKAGIVRDTIPDAASALARFLEFGEQVKTEWLARCASCRRLYIEELTYEFLINGSEDSHSYRRIDVGALLSWLTRHHRAAAAGELHRIGEDLWRIAPGGSREAQAGSKS